MNRTLALGLLASALAGSFGAAQCGSADDDGPEPFALRAVAVVVQDAAGGPLPGVECQLDGALSWRARSNADGYVLFPEVPAGLRDTQLSCEAEGFDPFTEHRQLLSGDNEELAPAVVSASTRLPRPAPVEREAPPLPSKAEFYRRYQANLGGIALPGCGLRNDILFDPQLLPMWLHDKPCFERAMAEHARRNDTVVVVSPAICYHGGFAGRCADVWHEPGVFAAFLKTIRAHGNANGETIEPHVIFVQPEHDDWSTLLLGGEKGAPDAAKEAHVMRDLEALAPLTQELVAGTAPAWEPRHQKNWMTAGQFERIAAAVARLWPRAWHGVHLVKESSSWSSWRCDPDEEIAIGSEPGGAVAAWQLPADHPAHCARGNAEGDDPNRGNETRAWVSCRKAGWCDGLMYQVPDGPKFLTPTAGDAGRDWRDRAREIADRLGRGERGWPKVDLIWFEFIYDRFHGRAPESLLEARCREAQEILMAPCGSASVRMR